MYVHVCMCLYKYVHMCAWLCALCVDIHVLMCVRACMCAHMHVLVHAWVVHVCAEVAGVSARPTAGVSQELTGSLADLALTKRVMLAGK